MIFDPPTRPRRRLWARLVWPLLIIAAVVLAVVVSVAGEETRTELEYLEQIHAQANDISRSGDALRDVVSRLERIERNEFETVIAGIEEDLSVGLELVDEEPPIASLLPVRALYAEALQTWNRGVEGYAASVLTAADEPQSVVVVDNMADALAEMRAGDNAYRRMVEAMEREDIPGPLSPMPDVTMMPSEGRLVTLSISYVDSARSETNELALRPGLAVSQIVADPPWEVNPEGQAVIPATSSVVFSVVVSNVGNVASEAVPLVLEVLGGPDIIRMMSDIAPLNPEQQVTVVFEPIDVEPGALYQVRAALAVTGADSSFDDNERAVDFTVNEE